MAIRAFQKNIRALLRDRRGNVAILSALAMPVLIGSLGIGAEVASWYGGKRALQNAADSAAIAAASNATDGGYAKEAFAVAAQYGFRDGKDGVSVTAQKGVPCPAGGNDCYRVTVTKRQPLFFSQVVGFKGDEIVDGSAYKRIASTAVAVQGMGPREYCILALGTSGKSDALLTHGAPFADMSGCNVMSNTGATCTGHDLKAEVGDAVKENNGCGKKQNSNMPTAADPYNKYAQYIPQNIACPKGYPVAPQKNKDPELPLENLMSGSYPAAALSAPICGDVALSEDVTITEPNTVLVIKDGSLDLRGHTLRTAPDASLTIVFTGTANREHAPIGSGTIDIAAPGDGNWKGIALYQDPATTNGIDISEAGNQPTWDITGVVYLPHSSVTFSGAVNKSSNGKSCFVLVADNITINGTGSILAHGECKDAGVPQPEGQAPTRGELVS